MNRIIKRLNTRYRLLYSEFLEDATTIISFIENLKVMTKSSLEKKNALLVDKFLSEKQNDEFRQFRDTPECRSKKQRPNYTSLGLNVRTLQNVGLIDHDLEPFKKTGDLHKEFCQLHKAAGWSKDLTEDQISKYKDAEIIAAIDALRKSQCVVCTPSQTADKLLLEAKKPMYTGHDEVCQAYDATSLMPLFNNEEGVAIGQLDWWETDEYFAERAKHVNAKSCKICGQPGQCKSQCPNCLPSDRTLRQRSSSSGSLQCWNQGHLLFPAAPSIYSWETERNTTRLELHGQRSHPRGHIPITTRPRDQAPEGKHARDRCKATKTRACIV